MDPGELRPLGVGEVLDVAMKIYRSNAAALLKAVLVVVAPVQVVAALVRVSGSSSNVLHTTSPAVPGGSTTVEFDPAALTGFVAATLAVVLLTVIASQLATGAVVKAVSGAYLGGRTDWRPSLLFASAYLGPLLWLASLGGALVFLGLLACVVPGVYLWAAWSVAVPALLIEDRRGLAALRRSRYLVRGRWGATFVVLLLAFLLAAVVQTVLTGVAIGLGSPGSNDAARAALWAMASTASATLTTPFTAAVIVVLYFDLRVRKEGFDLELLARRVGIAPAEGGWGWTRPGPDAGSPWDITPGRSRQGPPPRSGDPWLPPEDDRPPFWPPPPGWRPRG